MCWPNCDLTKVLIYSNNPVEAMSARNLLEEQDTNEAISIDTIICNDREGRPHRRLELFVRQLFSWHTHIFLGVENNNYKFAQIAKELYAQYDSDGEILMMNELTTDKAKEIVREDTRLREFDPPQYVTKWKPSSAYDHAFSQRARLAKLRAKHQSIYDTPRIELLQNP